MKRYDVECADRCGGEYDCDTEMVEAADGEYVRCEDAAKIEAENARLRKALKGAMPLVRIAHALEGCNCDECESGRRAIAAAREAIK